MVSSAPTRWRSIPSDLRRMVLCSQMFLRRWTTTTSPLGAGTWSVVVGNPGHLLKPNMFATAALSVQNTQDVQGIVLGADAIQRIDGLDAVFIEEMPGRYVLRPVLISARAADRVVLTSGVAVGERVVTEGAFALKSELEKGELGEGHAH